MKSSERIHSGKQENLFHKIILKVGHKDDMSAAVENMERLSGII